MGNDVSRLGVGLNGINDWDTSCPFIDLVKSTRAFGTAATPYDGKATLDPDGWPIGDFGICALTNIPGGHGTYKFIANTKVQQVVLVTGSGVVQNLAYDPATNVTTADIVMKDVSPNPVSMFLRVLGVVGTCKFQILRPGYTSADAIFTDKFLKMIEPFGGLRFMDWLRTNNSPITTWESRPTLQTARWQRVPYEICFKLLELTGKFGWFNLPPQGTDDHFTKFGELARASKAVGDFVIAYGNETWNYAGDFKITYDYCYNSAKAAIALGDPTLGVEGNSYYAGWRWTPKRLADAVKLLGSDPRFKFVLESQAGNPKVAEIQLAYLEASRGGVAANIDAIAIAPYTSAGQSAATTPLLTPGQYADKLYNNRAASWNTNVQTYYGFAQKYNVELWAYEGGTHDTNLGTALTKELVAPYYGKTAAEVTAAELTASQQKLQQAFFSGSAQPKTGQAIEEYLSLFFDSGGSRFMYFVICGEYTSYGMWGLTRTVEDLTQQKYQAGVRVAAKYRMTVQTPPEPPAPPVDPSVAKIEALELEVSRLTAQLDTAHQQIAQLTTTLADTRGEADVAADQVKLLQGQVVALNNAITSHEDTIAHLKGLIEAGVGEIQVALSKMTIE